MTNTDKLVDLLRECELFLRVLGIDSKPAANLAADCRAALAAHEAAAQTEPHDTRGPTTLEGWRSAALAGEKEREWLRERLKTVDRHQGKDCWYWQHDGEDHLESMTNALPVVIRAGHLRELLAAKAEPAGEAVPVLYVGLIERLMRLSTRLGIAHSDSVEHFAASLEDRLYAICRSAESLLDSLATPPAVPAPEAKAVPVHGSQP